MLAEIVFCVIQEFHGFLIIIIKKSSYIIHFENHE